MFRGCAGKAGVTHGTSGRSCSCPRGHPAWVPAWQGCSEGQGEGGCRHLCLERPLLQLTTPGETAPGSGQVSRVQLWVQPPAVSGHPVIVPKSSVKKLRLSNSFQPEDRRWQPEGSAGRPGCHPHSLPRAEPSATHQLAGSESSLGQSSGPL